jgi:hypothetical protein
MYFNKVKQKNRQNHYRFCRKRGFYPLTEAEFLLKYGRALAVLSGKNCLSAIVSLFPAIGKIVFNGVRGSFASDNHCLHSLIFDL